MLRKSSEEHHYASSYSISGIQMLTIYLWLDRGCMYHHVGRQTRGMNEDLIFDRIYGSIVTGMRYDRPVYRLGNFLDHVALTAFVPSGPSKNSSSLTRFSQFPTSASFASSMRISRSMPIRSSAVPTLVRDQEPAASPTTVNRRE